MEKLTEILAIFRKDDLEKFERYFSRVGNEGAEKKYLKLFKGIVEGKYHSDEEAALDIYGSSVVDKKYWSIQSYLLNKLLDFLIVTSDRDRYINTYSWVQFTCQKDWIRVNYLLKQSERKTAVYFAERIVNKAQKYEFTDLLVMCARELRYHYGYTGNKRQFLYYDHLLNKSLKEFEAEQKAESYFQRITLEFVGSAAASSNLENQEKEVIQELNELKKHVSTFNFNRYYYLLKAAYFQMKGDYRGTLKIVEEALQIFNTHPLARPINKAEWHFKRLVCCLHLLDIEKGEKSANEFRQLVPEGTNTWFAFADMYLLLLMYTDQYKEAIEFFNRVVTHKRFPTVDEARREKWKIFEAYLHYVNQLFGKGETRIVPIKGKSFKLERFLNDVPIYDKDKRGYNVTILIGHILLLLAREDYGQVIDRAEALKMYTSRHLRNDRYYRSNCFIKMLLIMVKENFDYERSKKLGRKYYQKLYKRSKDYQGKVDALEVIPYERLWAYVLGKLKASEAGRLGEQNFREIADTVLDEE